MSADFAAPSRPGVALALVTMWIVWGGTYLAIAVAIQTRSTSPVMAAGAQMLVGGALLLLAGRGAGGASGGRDPAARSGNRPE